MPWVRIPERSDEQVVMGLAIGVPVLAVGVWTVFFATSHLVLRGVGVVILLLGLWMVVMALGAVASSRADRGGRRRGGGGGRR